MRFGEPMIAPARRPRQGGAGFFAVPRGGTCTAPRFVVCLSR